MVSPAPRGPNKHQAESCQRVCSHQGHQRVNRADGNNRPTLQAEPISISDSSLSVHLVSFLGFHFLPFVLSSFLIRPLFLSFIISCVSILHAYIALCSLQLLASRFATFLRLSYLPPFLPRFLHPRLVLAVPPCLLLRSLWIPFLFPLHTLSPRFSPSDIISHPLLPSPTLSIV